MGTLHFEPVQRFEYSKGDAFSFGDTSYCVSKAVLQ